MLLEMLLRRSDELDGDELETAVLKARDDGTNEAALVECQRLEVRWSLSVQAGNLTWTPSGLIAMKL